MRLAARFGVWPLQTPPGQLTAAQALVIAEAIREPRARRRGERATGHVPKMPMSFLAQLARSHDPDVRVLGEDDV